MKKKIYEKNMYIFAQGAQKLLLIFLLEKQDDIFQNCFRILKLVVNPDFLELVGAFSNWLFFIINAGDIWLI